MNFSLVGIQRRISQGLKVLQYYTTKDWVFKNDNLRRLRDQMSTVDQQKFYFIDDKVSLDDDWIFNLHGIQNI